MKRRDLEDSTPLMWLIICGDIAIMLLCMGAVYSLFSWISPETVAGVDLSVYMTVAAITYVPLAFNLPPILLGRVVRVDKIIQRVVNLTVLHVLVFAGVLFLLKDVAIARKLLLSFFLVFTVLLCVERVTLRGIVRRFRMNGRNLHNVILVGDGEEMLELADYMRNKEYGFRILGIFSDLVTRHDGLPYLGRLSDVVAYLKEHEEVNAVYCTMSHVTKNDLLSIYSYCENNLVRFYALPMILNVLRHNMVMAHMGSTMMLSPRPEPLRDMGNRIIKRSFDVLVSGLFLLTLFPVIYVVAAIIIKRQSPGPALFLQKRNGINGKEFSCIKFRSMHVNAEADSMQATKNDPRKFAFGDFMRKTNIDELPQFINVFKGDMSLVGPRPHMLMHTDEYSQLINKYMVRHWVKPGITGWAQVNGFRGETRELRQMQERVNADIWYVENWTFWLDLRIMWKTLFGMVAHNDKNAY